MTSTSSQRRGKSRTSGSKLRIAPDGTPLPPKPRQAPRPPYNGPLYNWREISPGSQCLYLHTCEDANGAIGALLQPNAPKAVGFDIEWKPSFAPKQPENPVALLQISSQDRILLLQLSSMKALPGRLREFLESPRTAKVGVNIKDDCIKLWRDWGISVRNCIELSLLARSVDLRWTGKYNTLIGLAHLTEVYLERLLPKGRTARSNWEADLSEEQQLYAANDAHAGYMIYAKLSDKIVEMVPMPDPDCYTFSVIEGMLRDADGRPWFPFNPNYDAGEIPPVVVNAHTVAAILES